MKDRLLSWLNLALVVDTFLVIFSFLWLIVALLGRAGGVSLGLDIWYKLWQPIFTPAIGILIGGAVLSSLSKQVSQRLSKQG